MIRLLTLAFLVIAAPMAWPPSALAQTEVEVTLEATPREVQVGEVLRLEVRARTRGGRLEGLTLEDLKKYPELEILSQQTMRPMQFSFGFGSGVQVESSLAHVYVIRATAAGTYDFKPAVAKVDGKSHRSEPLTIVVHASGKAVAPSLADAPTADPGDELSGARYDPRAFLRTVVEPKEAYLGQQVDVTVYLYTRLRLSGNSLVPSKPPMDGFWVHDEPITSLQGETVLVKGNRYRAYVVHRSAAFPQRSGQLTIGAPKVTFDSGGASLFDTPERIERTGVPVTVDVKPLPQPGPPNALAGRYAVRASLDREAVQTGNAVTLHIEASGVGNVQDIRIHLPPMPGVRALQPAIRDQRRFHGDRLGGVRSWEWILIPEMPGEHKVPPIELHYFDPDTERYGVASTPALTFTSTGPPNPSQPVVSPADKPVKPEAAVFGPIRMYSGLAREAKPIRERDWFAWLLALPPGLFILLTLGTGIARRRQRQQATAGAVQRELLRNAQQALRGDDPRAFYDAIVSSITHALDSRQGEPVGGLPHTELRTRLVETGLDEDLVQRVINELEGADFARFAASGVNRDEMERCLQRTATIVERIQRSAGRS